MYSPRIKEELISRIYRLCRELKIPMTAFVNGATERALVLAEECVTRGQKEQVFGMIGVEVSAPVPQTAPAPTGQGGSLVPV